MAATIIIKILIVFSILDHIECDVDPLLKDIEGRKDLQLLVIDILNVLTFEDDDVTCITIICDPVYLNVFEGELFKRTLSVPVIMLLLDEELNSLSAYVFPEHYNLDLFKARVNIGRIYTSHQIVVTEYEDLLSPNFITLQAIRQARNDGCNVYLILLANGLQASRLLRFGDRYRILDTRAKFVMLHDFRLFHSDLHYLWKRIVNVIFLKYHKKEIGSKKTKAWFDLSTVPFPNPIRTVFVSKRIDIWSNGRFHYNRPLFEDKTTNLNGEILNVVYLDHTPSVVVVKSNTTNMISGVEIEILNTLANKMNFLPKLYTPVNAELHQWGQRQSNGSFSGLLGEMVNGKADIALGNLQYTPYHLELTDLSIPYISECLTFLTPEALTDNSWKTLILPFTLYMWIAVIVVLLLTGSIFYGLANYYKNFLKLKEHTEHSNNSALMYKVNMDEHHDQPVGLYLFGEIVNSILYTYGMLLVISLPKLPTGNSIRLLTGWYWLYCILLVVSYRASMTAILANPVPRVTIDTLKELVDSKVTCGGWGSETKKFFVNSLDEMTHKIGERFETINDPYLAANKVAEGVYAYYDNIYFLKYLAVRRKNMGLFKKKSDEYNSRSEIGSAANSSGDSETDNIDMERNLHIMSDCVVNIPVSIGFQKNSPLKPLADLYMIRIIEVGLVEKWLNDAMYRIRSLETAEEEIKALMNLKKLYGAFIALAIGYFLSLVALIGEFVYWNLIVKRDPKFDKYAMDIYYSNKSK